MFIRPLIIAASICMSAMSIGACDDGAPLVVPPPPAAAVSLDWAQRTGTLIAAAADSLRLLTDATSDLVIAHVKSDGFTRAWTGTAPAGAGMSRIYAGVHYRFDITAGQQIGRQVAPLAISKGL